MNVLYRDLTVTRHIFVIRESHVKPDLCISSEMPLRNPQVGNGWQIRSESVRKGCLLVS
jgi:hypothetical protein